MKKIETIKKIQEKYYEIFHNGKPPLEFGCEIQAKVQDDSYYEESSNFINIVGTVNNVGYIQFLDNNNCDIIDPINIKNFNSGYDETSEIDFKILGKPISITMLFILLEYLKKNQKPAINYDRFLLTIYGELKEYDSRGYCVGTIVKFDFVKGDLLRDQSEEVIKKIL